jgi:hypothetical protein
MVNAKQSCVVTSSIETDSYLIAYQRMYKL